MRKQTYGMVPIYALVIIGMILCTLIGDRAATVLSENAPIEGRTCFIIDAGHGGVDGGAVSCTGKYESHINLEIAIRLRDLMHLLGYKTKMIREDDISIYTQGETIAGKKASDLKERVRIVNETENAILLSIHQNHYSDSYYQGAQMFYPKTDGSEMLAKNLQAAFLEHLNPQSHRQAKPATGLYLMKHIVKTGVLIECGFLSNFQEEAKLRSAAYQKDISCVIAGVCARYVSDPA